MADHLVIPSSIGATWLQARVAGDTFAIIEEPMLQ